MSASDTPRTDARVVVFEGGLPVLNCTEVVNASFARQLERELAAAQSELLEQARLNGMGAQREARLQARIAELEAERDALRTKADAFDEKWHAELDKGDKLRAENMQLRNERDALRKDAERYRLVRTNNWSDIVAVALHEQREEQLDEAVDTELATLRRDSERYRWIRSRSNAETYWIGFPAVSAIVRHEPNTFEARFDAAIDAAMERW